MTSQEDELLENQITLLLQKTDANFERATEIASDMRKSMKGIINSMKDIHNSSQVWIDFFDSFMDTSQGLSMSISQPPSLVHPAGIMDDSTNQSFLTMSRVEDLKSRPSSFIPSIPFTPILPRKKQVQEDSSSALSPLAPQTVHLSPLSPPPATNVNITYSSESSNNNLSSYNPQIYMQHNSDSSLVN